MKRFASFAVLMGIFFGLLAGAASTASASVTTGGFDCQNVAVNVLSCNDTTVSPDIKVDIDVDRTLNNNEIVSVENTLNNLTVNAANLSNVKAAVANVCGSFNPSVDIDKIFLFIGGILVAVL